MSLINRIGRFAASPHGRRLFGRAKRYAQSPEGRRRVEQARGQIAARRQQRLRPR